MYFDLNIVEKYCKNLPNKFKCLKITITLNLIEKK